MVGPENKLCNRVSIFPPRPSDSSDGSPDPGDRSPDPGDVSPDPPTRRENRVAESRSVPIQTPEPRDAQRFHATLLAIARIWIRNRAAGRPRVATVQQIRWTSDENAPPSRASRRSWLRNGVLRRDLMPTSRGNGGYDRGTRISVAGSSISVAGSSISVAGSSISVVGSSISVAGSSISSSDPRSLSSDPRFCRRLLDLCHRLLDPCRRLLDLCPQNRVTGADFVPTAAGTAPMTRGTRIFVV